MKPYLVVSDLHGHSWSVYATVNPDGVNSRLRIMLDELVKAAHELKKAGGTILVIAGDVFHVRGSLDPEVLNPIQAVFRQIMDMGISIYMIPGNHDLKTKDTSELGSAIQTLAETFSSEGSIRVFNEPSIVKIDDDNMLGFVPWRHTVPDLLSDLEALAIACPAHKKMDVFIHAGIDGVLSGVPAHGLPASRLASIGFRRVFAGHYHHQCDMGDGVWSIGALTHQTWSDEGTIAGYLMVDENEVRCHESAAPKFIDVSGLITDPRLEDIVRGNYVRFRGAAMKPEDVRELRKFFEDAGAKGISIQSPKQVAATRTTAGTSGKTVDQSVEAYVNDNKDIPAHIDREEVKRQAADILLSVRSVSNAA